MIRESIACLGDTKKADKSWKKLFIAYNKRNEIENRGYQKGVPLVDAFHFH